MNVIKRAGKWNIAIALFFLTVFVCAHCFDWRDATAPVFERAIRENNARAFVVPMLFWVGSASYLLIGDASFVAVPLATLSITVLFMLRLFTKFKLPKPALLLCFLVTSKWISAINFFNRDAMLFMLAAIFTYYFFAWIKEKHRQDLFMQGACVFGMTFTKDFWGVFAGFFLLGILFAYRRKLNFLPAAVPYYKEIETQCSKTCSQFCTTISNVQGNILQLPSASVYYLLATLANPIYAVSGLLFFKKREFIHFAFFMATLMIGGTIIAMGKGAWVNNNIRYSLALVPFHLYFIGKALAKVKGTGWLKVLLVFAIGKAISGLFYLDAIWKLII